MAGVAFHAVDHAGEELLARLAARHGEQIACRQQVIGRTVAGAIVAAGAIGLVNGTRFAADARASAGD